MGQWRQSQSLDAVISAKTVPGPSSAPGSKARCPAKVAVLPVPDLTWGRLEGFARCS